MTLELLEKAIQEAKKTNPKGWKYMDIKIIDNKYGAHKATSAYTTDGKSLLII